MISGREIIRFDAPIGNRSPMHTLAMGKAILAFRPVEEQDDYIESCDFKPFTPNTITDPSKYLIFDIRISGLSGLGESMNSSERVMAALDLKEPGRVPFMDFVDTAVKRKIMATDDIDEAELARKIGMDAVTLHVPGTSETRHLLSAERFGLMKDGVVIINTARGDVVDPCALLAALANGKVAAAGLNVLPEGSFNAGLNLGCCLNLQVARRRKTCNFQKCFASGRPSILKRSMILPLKWKPVWRRCCWHQKSGLARPLR